MKYAIAIAAAAGLMSAAAHADEALVGTWDGEGWFMTVFEEGYMVPGSVDPAMAWAVAGFEAADGQITFSDVAAGCDADGVYAYAVEGDSVTFTRVEDECEGRIRALDGSVLTKRASDEAMSEDSAEAED